ncbi:DNA polymerase III subunit chi [Salipiger abyssi]|uniref:DNA polymerase III, chi subunit n=1 Tax=Salipiger abyssi TaxID=1250539 RepID=A0A1P8UYY7_9RHOB|nr:DNA polymerase III subunit chi [Salipiger abyssi]APZ54576.1 DNA polymerase III, chi subunit [Salipiger abyssi]MBN9886337.1 DNA polymerase III subunit chi [Salipiger abyssi]
MGAAYFYHLTQRPLEATLPVLLEKSLAAGWRVAVRGTDPARMDWLDQRLWLGPEEGFLPHGLAGGKHDALQPVLLTVQTAMPNDAACLMAVDGAEVAPDEVSRLDRVCILFDGHDAMAVEAARGQWRALTGAGCKAQYWSEESGRWEKKAEA